MDIRKECSLQDCKELKQMIIENPELPLLVFAGEEAWSGEWSYESSPNNCSCYIKELTLYKDMWQDKSDYEESLRRDYENMEEFANLTDDEFFNMIDKKVAETEFVKAICLYVG